MGGTCDVWEEPGKQKPRSFRAQELARSNAQEMSGRKSAVYFTQRESREEADLDQKICANYSYRKATMGSTRIARRAGM
jgi:hypothetical protein